MIKTVYFLPHDLIQHLIPFITPQKHRLSLLKSVFVMAQHYSFQNAMVAIDGSDKSKDSFNQAIDLMGQDPTFKTINVIHVWNKNKTYLPKSFTKDHIEQEYKNELLSRFPQNRYNLLIEDHHNKFENCREQILDICTQNKGDFLFIGYTGRKGVKDDPNIMSQTVRSAALSSLLPLIIVKQLYLRKNIKSDGYNYLVCVDGSKKAFQCLNKAIGLAINPRDKIITCFSPSPLKLQHQEVVSQEVKKQIQTTGFKGNWEHINLKPNYDAADEIIKFVNLNENLDIHFVVLGNNGYRAEQEAKSFFGKSAEQILCKIIANPIIIS